MAEEEIGVEGELVRMLELGIRPCIICKVFKRRIDGPEGCPTKDDGAFSYNKRLLLSIKRVFQLITQFLRVLICDNA